MDRSIVENSLYDPGIISLRYEIADKVSLAFISAGKELSAFEEIDCVEKNSINRQKIEDETRAISLITGIAGDLTKSASMLYKSEHAYSASALIRQLVEVEYLAWTFENDPAEAQKWIHSSQKERMDFFTPAKLRKAAGNRFRSKDYGYHCELGGHPVPGAEQLLVNEGNLSQLLLSDMISHTWRIWDHLVNWAMKSYDNHPLMRWALRLIKVYEKWEKLDVLTKLPPPP